MARNAGRLRVSLRWLLGSALGLGLFGLAGLSYSFFGVSMFVRDDDERTVIRSDTRLVHGSLRLLDRIPEADPGLDSRIGSVNLHGQFRKAISASIPFAFSYTVDVPSNAYLYFGLNRSAESTDAGKVRFTIQAVSSRGRVDLFETTVGDSPQRWRNGYLDLTAYSGRTVKLRFSAVPAEASGSAAGDVGYWSDLFLGTRRNTTARPNIFVILIDTLRYDHVSCYGYHRPTTPNIDRLATEGARFDRAISTAPWTDPAILSLFTGLYPSDVWKPLGHKEAVKELLPSGVETLAEVLSKHGYFTIAASDHPGVNYKRFGQGFDIYSTLYFADGPRRGWRETEPAKVRSQLRELLTERSPNNLFVYVHLIYPHAPYDPGPPYDNLFEPGSSRAMRPSMDGRINDYDGEIKRTDDFLGDFLNDLKELGLDKNAVLVILSDHGEGFGEHGFVHHGNSLFNELLRIPLVIHAPGRVPAGTTIGDLVRIVDVMPTILDLVGIAGGEHYRGSSLVPLMSGARESARLGFSEFPAYRIIRGQAIQSSVAKVIVPNTKRKWPNCFDLTSDPGEQTNRWHDGLVWRDELVATLDEIARTAATNQAQLVSEQEAPSEEMIRRLRSLGYVDD